MFLVALLLVPVLTGGLGWLIEVGWRTYSVKSGARMPNASA